MIHKNIIEDIYIIPATYSNENSAVIRLDLAPMRLALRGSVHSHPSGAGLPSMADLNFFMTKDVNLIAYFPFCLSCYKAYNKQGERIYLDVVEDTKNI